MFVEREEEVVVYAQAHLSTITSFGAHGTGVLVAFLAHKLKEKEIIISKVKGTITCSLTE